MNSDKTFYILTYKDPQEDNKIVSLQAKTIKDSNLGLSFISVSNFVFDTSEIVIDPTMEKLKKRFENTKSMHISIYNVISIEEVGLEHAGLRFAQDKSNLVVFPNNP